MILPAPAAAALEQLLNGCLQLAPDAAPVLAQLAGRRVRIEVLTPLPEATVLSLWCDGEHLHVDPDPGAGGADAVVRGTPFALARLGTGQIADSGAEFSGDAVVAATLRRLFRDHVPEFEEVLSRLVGDVLAHQFTRTLRPLRQWQQKAVETVLRDAGEYLQFENRALAPSADVAAFCDAVDGLREDADRLEARIERLHRRLQAEP